jgi:hypothetical protein
MAEGGQNLVVPAEILVDCLRLGGRFDDDDVHSFSLKEYDPQGSTMQASDGDGIKIVRHMAALFVQVKGKQSETRI